MAERTTSTLPRRTRWIKAVAEGREHPSQSTKDGRSDFGKWLFGAKRTAKKGGRK